MTSINLLYDIILTCNNEIVMKQNYKFQYLKLATCLLTTATVLLLESIISQYFIAISILKVTFNHG